MILLDAIKFILHLFTPASRNRGRFVPATEKQLNYLKVLIEQKNQFRSHPIDPDAWIEGRLNQNGEMGIGFASDLIDSLLTEVTSLKKRYADLMSDRRVGVRRERFFVTDITAFYFCENSAFYSIHGFPSLNVLDLRDGEAAHSRAWNKEGPKSGVSDYTQALKKYVEGFKKAEWFLDDKAVAHHSKRWNLSGKPDGVVYYKDGSKSFIELKTVQALPDQIRPNDSRQLSIYRLIHPRPQDFRGNGIVLYQDRVSQDLRIGITDPDFTERDLDQTVNHLERLTRPLRPKNLNEKKCFRCGYRSVCEFSKFR